MSEITFLGTDFSVPIRHIGLYSDNTPIVKTEQFDEIVAHADTVLLRPSNTTSLVTGLAMVRGVHYAGGHIKNLILPYIPGARQDRVNHTGDVLFTLGFVADMINSQNFKEVWAVDPHSLHAGLEIKHLREFPLERVYAHLWKGYGGVIAPDKGAKFRAEDAGRTLDIPVTYGRKVRDESTGKLSGFDVDVEAGKHYIVIDDICDGGGTFVGLGEKIKEQGAYADLFVTHGIFSKGTAELKKFYKNIYTTNTRDFSDRNDVMVFDIVKGMIEYV